MASLLDHFFGVAVEGTFGLPTTASMRFYEWTPGSALDSDPKVVEPTGIRQGSLFDRLQRRVGVVGQGTGSVQVDMFTRGMNLLLGLGLGTATSTNVSGSVYQCNITPALPGGTTLNSFTAQEGIIRPDGTQDALTWAGATIRGFELACSSMGLLTLKADVDAKPLHVVRSVTDGATTNTSPTVTSATAVFTANDAGRPISGTGIPAATTILSVQSSTSVTLSANATATATGVTITIGTAAASPSYPAAATTRVFHYGQLTGSLGGTLTAPTGTALASVTSSTTLASLRSFSLKVDNALDDGRWNGSQARRQPTVGRRTATLTADTEYDSTTGVLLREAQLNQTDVGPIVLTFTGESIAAAANEVLQVVLPSVKIDGGAIPQPSDDKTIVTSVNYKIGDNLSAAQPIWLVSRTLDSAA